MSQDGGPRTEEPGQKTQDRQARSEDPGQRTQQLGWRRKDRTEDCESRTLDESKPWMTKNFH